jgi:Ca2+-binding EF-hand superfamily protein
MSTIFTDSMLGQQSAIGKHNASTIKELRVIFDVFDKNKDGIIDLQEFTTVIRAINFECDERKIEEMLTSCTHDDKGLDFQGFMKIMEGNMKTSHMEADLLRAFKVFDRGGTGFLKAVEFKHALSTLGGSLTPDEIARMIKQANADDKGRIDYSAWAKKIFGKTKF